ncbi:hypothetical protein GCM10009550_39760 [Actinocorallia libanotica]|uniref:DUF4333 domain-containing protein n=1 Tax=Actinocorallia libanotica TaxID=46162 RepID=A0ABP4BXU2_9ACTN
MRAGWDVVVPGRGKAAVCPVGSCCRVLQGEEPRPRPQMPVANATATAERGVATGGVVSSVSMCMRLSRVGVVVAGVVLVGAVSGAFWLVPRADRGTGCPREKHGTVVDWTPFLRFGGRTYHSTLFEAPERVGRAKVGEEVGKVVCHLSSRSDAERLISSYPDGTAPFLRVGTSVHRLVGHPVECRVVVDDEGDFTVYVARHEVNGRDVPSCPDGTD